MPQPSKWIFSTFTLPILKTIINLQNFSVQSCHHRHKGSYTGELHCLFLQPWRQPYLTRSGKGIDACGMVVHSGLYIPVSSYLHQSKFAGLGIYLPRSSADPHTWALICFKMCWYKATFVRAVISTNKPFGKQMFSSHFYSRVGACLFYHTVLW